MAEKRRRFAADFKRNAVELLRTSGRSVTEISTELGIDRALLDRWRREAQEGETTSRKAFVGHGSFRDEEVARLRKENADLKETNEILKKAMVIFTQKSPR